MIYLFERIPINVTDEQSIQKMFSKISSSAKTQEIAEQVDIEKYEFYTFFLKIQSDKNYIPKQQTFEEHQEYLKKVFDLLEIGIKANFAMQQDYMPFLMSDKTIKPRGEISSCLMAEYILSRYVYSLGTIKFLKKKIQLLAKDSLENDQFNSDLCKEIINGFKIGFIRLLKVYENKSLIWSQLKSQHQGHDLSLGSLDIIYKVNEINLSNLYVFEMIMSKDLEQKLINFLCLICKSTINKISNIHFLIKNFVFYSEIHRLKNFLETYMLFYQLLFNNLILKSNKLIEEKIDIGYQESKSISQIYYENYLISNKIFDLEKKLEDLGNKKETQILPYILELASIKTKEKPIFFPFIKKFYTKKIRNRDLLKEGIKNFEQMQEDILSHLQEKPSINDIYNQIDSKDVIQMKIKKFLEEDQ